MEIQSCLQDYNKRNEIESQQLDTTGLFYSSIWFYQVELFVTILQFSSVLARELRGLLYLQPENSISKYGMQKISTAFSVLHNILHCTVKDIRYCIRDLL